MNIRNLSAFITTVHAGSINKAAALTGYTQAGLTYIINNLEKELGLKLLERDFSGIRLNENGIALMPKIERIVADYKDFESALNERCNSELPSIKIGAYESIILKWLPTVISRFKKKYPGVQISLLNGTPFEIADWIADGSIDFGLSDRNFMPKSLYFDPLFHDPYIAVLPLDSKITDPASITAFEGMDFIPTEYNITVDAQKFFQYYNVKTNFLDFYLSNSSVIMHVAAGLGFSILPHLYLPASLDNVKLISLKEKLYRQLGVFAKSKSSLSSMNRKFIRILKNTITEIEKPPLFQGEMDPGIW